MRSKSHAPWNGERRLPYDRLRVGYQAMGEDRKHEGAQLLKHHPISSKLTRKDNMSTHTENTCFRCRTDCVPVSNLSADEPNPDGSAVSFICVGYNKRETRTVPQDRFTFCWKNSAVDERGHWDKRDLLDTMSVIAQALSTDENIRLNEGMTEDEMQQADMC